jgi:hypothetical protein
MLDATLLTGDWHLNELANANGLLVHGALWLLDEMVHFGSAASRYSPQADARTGREITRRGM